VASGLPTDAFLYLGYLPRKRGERQRLLREIAELPYTLIFLETPHRLLAALEDLGAVLGDRQMAVARELTKLHEEVFRGKINEARDYFSVKAPRGEFTLVLAGSPSGSEAWSEARVQGAIARALESGAAPGEIARQISAESGWSRRELYDLVMERKKERENQ
jgi:16S rRNA (cytidine1402-2'-O)-methyltransferase